MEDFYVDNFQRLDYEAKKRDEKYDKMQEKKLLEKTMGKDFKEFFHTPEEVERVNDERNQDHYLDNLG